MHDSYDDIIAATSRPPLWHDENGTPRFAEHRPELCPDIYAVEVALLRIACQGCDREFSVQMSCSRPVIDAIGWMRGGSAIKWCHELLEAMTAASDANEERAKEFDRAVGRVRSLARLLDQSLERSLAARIRDGSIHYGDPPNADCCAAGSTMNCMDLAVVEYWARGAAREALEKADKLADLLSVDRVNAWKRFPELEIALPDAKEESP